MKKNFGIVNIVKNHLILLKVVVFTKMFIVKVKIKVKRNLIVLNVVKWVIMLLIVMLRKIILLMMVLMHGSEVSQYNI